MKFGRRGNPVYVLKNLWIKSTMVISFFRLILIILMRNPMANATSQPNVSKINVGVL